MRWGRLAAENYRGVLLSRVLGLPLAAAGALSTIAIALVGVAESSWRVRSPGWSAMIGTLLVFAAGLIDDVSPMGPRGLRKHLRALAAGHMTTGILKLLVTVAASIVVVGGEARGDGLARAAGVVLIAGCANLWNGLDVRPGRALKAFLVIGITILFADPDWRLVPVLPGVLVGALPCLFLDLRERAMLGDGGANLVGFVAGMGLYAVTPGGGVCVGAVATVVLNVLADTVTLSRLIDAFPPLRWVDRLGRILPPSGS